MCCSVTRRFNSIPHELVYTDMRNMEKITSRSFQRRLIRRPYPFKRFNSSKQLFHFPQLPNYFYFFIYKFFLQKIFSYPPSSFPHKFNFFVTPIHSNNFSIFLLYPIIFTFSFINFFYKKYF